MSGKGAVQLADVVLSYGTQRVVHGISLDIAPGEFVCLLGPSGCGKTTTLRAIAGLAAVDSGTIAIDGAVANAKPAHERPQPFVDPLPTCPGKYLEALLRPARQHCDERRR